MTVRIVMLFSSLLVSGLIAGLFFGWTVSVIPGTSLVDDRSYVTTMQNINRAIINPAFVFAFMAPPVLLAIASYSHWRAGYHRRAVLLATAAGVYLVGVLGVTMGGNVPLNDALDEFVLDQGDTASLADRRQSYETSWNQWHNVRMAASVASFAVAAAAALVDSTD